MVEVCSNTLELRGYLGDGVDGMTRGASSFGGEDGGGCEEDQEDGWCCEAVVLTCSGDCWGVGIRCAAVISGVRDLISD